MSELSIAMITYNAQDEVKNALESVKWAEEIIVVDCFSKDNTVEVVKNYTDKIWQRAWPGHAKQWNFAIEQATKDWVFILASDEVLTEELHQEINNILKGQNNDIEAYYVPRKAYFLNRWIRHCGWYPGYTLRLFKRGKAKYNDRLVHENIIFSGKADYLKGALLHFSYRSISQYLDRLNCYTTLEAQQMFEQKKKKNDKIMLKMILDSWKVFKKMYFKQRGYKEGMYGFILCTFSAFYKFVTYAKYWELLQKKSDHAT